MSNKDNEIARLTSIKQCFNCGKETTGEARLDDDLQIDSSVPLRPACNECGPQWEIVEELR